MKILRKLKYKLSLKKKKVIAEKLKLQLVPIWHCFIFSNYYTIFYNFVTSKNMESGGIPTIIPQQILQLKHIFGVNTTIPKSISLLSSDRLFYIGGYQGVVYNPREKEKSQSYYPGA